MKANVSISFWIKTLTGNCFCKNDERYLNFVLGQGSVEGLAFEEKERDLYWTCQSDASINRMSIDPFRTQRVEKIVHLDPGDKPRGIAVDSCDL